ncbi:hypothetical protein HDV00_003687 [Rhizophlyctis rosea]|nr:hypothetical protein HDV00_003687 [Rhizophlyctis rosea]
MHQDAHEMLNFLLNSIVEVLARHKKEFSDKLKPFTIPPVPPILSLPEASSLKKGGGEEVGVVVAHLRGERMGVWDARGGSSGGTDVGLTQFRMKVKKLPNVLAVHLKRFKYQERLGRYIKLSYRVLFPLELRLFNTADDATDSDRLYKLFAFIVHVGSGPYHGHYVTVVKSYDQWFLFDDDEVRPLDEADLQRYYGDTPNVGCGYIFFYMADGYDATELVRSMVPDDYQIPSQDQPDVVVSPDSGEPPTSPSVSMEKLAGAAMGGAVEGRSSQTGLSIPAVVNAKKNITKLPSVTLLRA